MKLELALENEDFLEFVRAFETAGWPDGVKPALSLRDTEPDLHKGPARRSVEQIGAVAFTISILTPALKILADVIKVYLASKKTQLEIRNGTKRIAISGPSPAVEEILGRLQDLDSQPRP
jgi:hypothetical protein